MIDDTPMDATSDGRASHTLCDCTERRLQTGGGRPCRCAADAVQRALVQRIADRNLAGMSVEDVDVEADDDAIIDALADGGWLAGQPNQRRTDIDPPTLEHYTRALDEIYALRCLAAYHAAVLEAHLDLKSLPAGRRPIAENQVAQLRQAARGDGTTVYQSVGRRSLLQSLAAAGLGTDTSLTRSEWEAEPGVRQRSDGLRRRPQRNR